MPSQVNNKNFTHVPQRKPTHKGSGSINLTRHSTNLTQQSTGALKHSEEGGLFKAQRWDDIIAHRLVEHRSDNDFIKVKIFTPEQFSRLQGYGEIYGTVVSPAGAAALGLSTSTDGTPIRKNSKISAEELLEFARLSSPKEQTILSQCETSDDVASYIKSFLANSNNTFTMSSINLKSPSDKTPTPIKV